MAMEALYGMVASLGQAQGKGVESSILHTLMPGV